MFSAYMLSCSHVESFTCGDYTLEVSRNPNEYQLLRRYNGVVTCGFATEYSYFETFKALVKAFRAERKRLQDECELEKSYVLENLEHYRTPTAPVHRSMTGYGMKIPTNIRVYLPHSEHAFRVYATCFSNAASYWVKTRGQKVFLR